MEFLDNNRVQAISRDIRLNTQLEKRPEVVLLFEEEMNNTLTDGIQRKANDDSPNNISTTTRHS